MAKRSFADGKARKLLIFSGYFLAYVVVGAYWERRGGPGAPVVLAALILGTMWLAYTVVFPSKVLSTLKGPVSVPLTLEFSFLPVLVSLVGTALSWLLYGIDTKSMLVALLGTAICSSGIAAVIFLKFSGKIRAIREEGIRLENIQRELRLAISRKKELSGMIPICSYCHKIRDDKGFWNQVETYIERNTNTLIEPFMCPECEKRQRQGQ